MTFNSLTRSLTIPLDKEKAIVEHGLPNFLKVGNAFVEIHAHDLWRGGNDVLLAEQEAIIDSGFEQFRHTESAMTTIESHGISIDSVVHPDLLGQVKKIRNLMRIDASQN